MSEILEMYKNGIGELALRKRWYEIYRSGNRGEEVIKGIDELNLIACVDRDKNQSNIIKHVLYLAETHAKAVLEEYKAQQIKLKPEVAVEDWDSYELRTIEALKEAAVRFKQWDKAALYRDMQDKLKAASSVNTPDGGIYTVSVSLYGEIALKVKTSDELLSQGEADKITNLLYSINRIIEGNNVCEKQSQLSYLYAKAEGKILCLLNKINPPKQ